MFSETFVSFLFKQQVVGKKYINILLLGVSFLFINKFSCTVEIRRRSKKVPGYAIDRATTVYTIVF